MSDDTVAYLNDLVEHLDDDIRYLSNETNDIDHRLNTLIEQTTQLAAAVRQLAYGHPFAAQTILKLDPEQFGNRIDEFTGPLVNLAR